MWYGLLSRCARFERLEASRRGRCWSVLGTLAADLDVTCLQVIHWTGSFQFYPCANQLKSLFSRGWIKLHLSFDHSSGEKASAVFWGSSLQIFRAAAEAKADGGEDSIMVESLRLRQSQSTTNQATLKFIVRTTYPWCGVCSAQDLTVVYPMDTV